MVMIMDLSRFAYITAIGTLADSLISLISLITVSRLSTIAVAATGIVSYLFFVINAASMIFTGGLMVLISQAVGEGKLKLAENASAETLSLAIVSSLIALVSMPTWLKPYLELVSMGNTEILSESYIYASMRLLSLPAMLINASLSAIYRASDDALTPTICSLVSASSGAIMIPAMALGFLGFPRMELFGAGLGSSVSTYLGSMIYILRPPSLRIRISRPKSLAMRVIWIGLPTAAERIVASISQNVYINAVARGGTLALAAHNIGITVETVIIQPSFAVGMTALVKAGQSLGSEEEVNRVLRRSLRIGVSWMGLASILLIVISPFVGKVFSSDPNVAKLTSIYLILAATSEIGLGISQAFFGAIRGMGSVWIPFLISSTSLLFLRALPAQLLSIKYGAIGAWVTQNTDMYGRVAISYVVWKALGRRLIRRVLS
jgi:putative MATE family efflux protein